MSKIFKSVARIALPVIGTALGGPVGGAIGGAIGGAVGGGGIKGALTGAALGGIGGAISSAGGVANAAQNIGLGTVGAPLTTNGIAGGVGNFTSGSGLAGLLSSAGRGVTSVLSPLSSLASSITGSGGTAAGGASQGILGSNPLLSLASVAGPAYSAISGANAAEKAAAIQAKSNSEAINAQKEALTQVRGDLQPFRDMGTQATPVLSSLVNDPQAQLNFIQNNPFYQSLAKDTQDRLFANQAARGKIGSGGTASALQNSLMLLGNDLLNQKITQNQNLVATGANAAAQTGTATQNSAQNIGGYLTDRGDALASGKMGAYNAQTGAINNALGGLTSLYGINKGIPMKAMGY